MVAWRSTCSASSNVDLVLTDLMMPVMDGEELATAMRKRETYRDTPIILMTSLPTARSAAAGPVRRHFAQAVFPRTVASDHTRLFGHKSRRRRRSRWLESAWSRMTMDIRLRAGTVLARGLGGFVDGIVLHQIAQCLHSPLPARRSIRVSSRSRVLHSVNWFWSLSSWSRIVADEMPSWAPT